MQTLNFFLNCHRLRHTPRYFPLIFGDLIESPTMVLRHHSALKRQKPWSRKAAPGLSLLIESGFSSAFLRYYSLQSGHRLLIVTRYTPIPFPLVLQMCRYLETLINLLYTVLRRL